MKKSAKVIHLRVSVGTEDERTIESFRDHVVNAIKEHAHPKNVTVLGMEHLHEGQRYSVPEWQEFSAKSENTEEVTEDAGS